MTGAVGGGTGALGRRPLAELGRHASEWTLVDVAVLGTAEGNTIVVELVDCAVGVAAHVLDGVLVAQPVGAFHGIVHVPAPVVVAHVADGGGDTTLRSHRVRARGENLGDARSLQSRFGAAERGAQA